MNKEKDFFKTCFNTLTGLEVKNESQAIAKEVVLSEIENLQQENKQLKIQIRAREEKYRKLEDKYKELDKMCELYSKSLYNAELNQYKDNWNKLKDYIKTEIPEDVFIDTEWFVSILDKMQELEGSDSNEI